MANIRMNPNTIGKYSFQRTKILNQPTSSVNGTSKEFSSTAPPIGYLHGTNYKTTEENKCYLPFAEKLKHLLENGNSTEHSNKDDPYAFSDVELSSISPSINGYNNDNVNHFSLPNIAAQTVTNRTITHAQQPRVPVAVQISQLKHTPSTSAISCLSQPSTSITPVLQTSHLKKCVGASQPTDLPTVKNCLPTKPIAAPLQLPKNFRLTQTQDDKPGKNIKLMLTPYNGRLPAGGGKPMNFGKSQMSKLAIAKIEKSMETKQKNGSKGKNVHSPQKNSQINRKVMSKAKRLSPIRSGSLDSDSPTVRSKVSNKKSLLEESLIGGKQIEWTANRTSCSLSGTSSPVVQTATPTVTVSPRLIPRAANHKALQQIWNLRNKMKSLKRTYQSFGLLLDEPRENLPSSCEEHIVQNYWFSLCNDYSSSSGLSRNAKLAQLKTELRHKLQQQQWRCRDEYQDEMAKLLIRAARHKPNLTAFLFRLESSNRLKNKFDLCKGQVEGKRECGYQHDGVSECGKRALPHLGFCKTHAIRNRSQLLFTPCSALSSQDSALCGAPALGRPTDHAFCAFHQRLQLNFQKPKKVSGEKPDEKLPFTAKKNRSPHTSSRAGRSRKRKRQAAKEKKETIDVTSITKESESSLIQGESRRLCLTSNTLVMSKSDVDESQDVEVGEDLPIDSVELASLATHASRLLEEHDFTNVLNHIPTDAFNDLFTGDKEEYEPTLQETEELERALEAVDNDVKSLEKLTQNHGILDLLDEQTIAQTLAALPEVVPVLYQNGFSGLGPLEQSLCGLHPDNMNALPIQPQTDVLQS